MHLWLETRTRGDLAVSDWTLTETASALSIKVRTGDLAPEHRRAVDALLTTWLDASFEHLPIPRTAFADAARLLRRFDTGLRAGDALHLATSALHRSRLVTLDPRLAQAGDALGLDVELL